MNRRTPTLVGLSLLAVGVVGGLVYAAIPGANGVIQGCYDSGGNLKVVNALPCPKGFTPLPWNAQGVTRDKGETGATGATGTTGTVGATGAPGAAGVALADFVFANEFVFVKDVATPLLRKTGVARVATILPVRSTLQRLLRIALFGAFAVTILARVVAALLTFYFRL